MYVVKFILNFTSHLDFEQLIPNCGENEFYYKYTHLLKKIYINLSFFYVNNNMVITYSNTSWGFNRLLISGLNLEEGMIYNLPFYFIKTIWPSYFPHLI